MSPHGNSVDRHLSIIQVSQESLGKTTCDKEKKNMKKNKKKIKYMKAIYIYIRIYNKYIIYNEAYSI